MPTISPRRTCKSTPLIDLPVGVERVVDRQFSTSNMVSPIFGVALRIAVRESRPTMLRMMWSSLDRLGAAIERLDGRAVAQHGDAVGDAARSR